ncbi:MAG: Gfo/Idh/MocA family oxidoreductase [Bacteroidota bacterium]
MSRTLSLCIVGLGRAGRFHLHSIKQLPGVELAYVVDPVISEQEEALEGTGCKVLTDIQEALDDHELDGVIVSSPTQYHYDYIIRSLSAGKHVFTEKPLGKSLDQIAHCFDLAEEKELALYLGFQRRYDQNFRALKEKLQQIGSIRLIKTSSRDNPKPSIDYLRISGNIFYDMLIHDFDMLLFLLEGRKPESIFAYGHAYDPEIKAIPDFDTVMVSLKYSDGLIVNIDTSRIAAYGYDQRIELFGEQGMAIADNQRNSSVQLHTASGTLLEPINYSFPQRYKESYLMEISDFVQGILEGRRNNVSKEDCLLGHRMAEAAHEAAISGKMISLK